MAVRRVDLNVITGRVLLNICIENTENIERNINVCHILRDTCYFRKFSCHACYSWLIENRFILKKICKLKITSTRGVESKQKERKLEFQELLEKEKEDIRRKGINYIGVIREI